MGVTQAESNSFFCSSVGKKYLMGISGLIWAGFVFGHMAGNMLMFIGADLYNQYGHALTSGMLIYAVEAVLLVSIITHVGLAINLTLENRKAKGSRYAVGPSAQKGGSLASRTMAAQGSLILAFIILHLITFKFGTYYETTVNGVVMRDLHRLMVEVFQSPGYVAWYVVCLVLLGFHLSHGVKSIFQSFGVLTEKWSRAFHKISIVYAVVVALGFLAQPIYVFLFL